MGMLTERPRPRFVREHPQAGWLAVTTVCFGAFMGQLDASVVTLTFPALQQEFHAPLAAVQWVSLAYLLGLVGLLVAVGQVADAVGRKMMYLQGFALFTAASAACGLAPGLGWLVVFRLLQAFGAAMLQANSVALVVTSMPRDRMRAGLGVQAAAQALGLALGPPVAGALVASVGWRWVFLVNVPVGCAAWFAGRYLLPRTRERTPLRRFDWPGLALLAVATTALLLALSAVSGLSLPGWFAIALLVVSVGSTVAFVGRERRAATPLVDLSLMRSPPVAASLAGALCGYLVLFGPLTLFPQVFDAHSAAGVGTGFMLTALPAGFATAAVAAEKVLPQRWGVRARSIGGAMVALLATGALAFAPTHATWVVILLLVLGFGLGIFIPANNTSIMAALPARVSAVGGGLVNMGRSLGTALGVALVTLSLHAAAQLGEVSVGPRLALSVLALFALAAGASGVFAHRLRSSA